MLILEQNSQFHAGTTTGLANYVVSRLGTMLVALMQFSHTFEAYADRGHLQSSGMLSSSFTFSSVTSSIPLFPTPPPTRAVEC
jgi:hypothetical protein